jgi:DNA invertase Pin-like site-specific DNA recombinase
MMPISDQVMAAFHLSFYRVSTDKQGRSGLGLDAQAAAVAAFVAGRGDILQEFTEIESGKKNDRPRLALCRKHKAKLLIAKLDRLARNVYFISGLMENGVDFVAVDMPEANRFTIHILAAIAEHEREMISQRTKAALAAAKVKGIRLGNPTPLPASLKAGTVWSAHTAKFRETARPLLLEIQAKGYSYNAIAKELSHRHVPTANGRQWYHKTVSKLLSEGRSSKGDSRR